jgi:hypothetical protein
MADGTAGRNGASGDDDHVGVPPRGEQQPQQRARWPVAAICCVTVLTVLVLLLLLMNVLGLQLGRDGGYDAEAGGSVAEWFGAIATLVALPAAVLFGVRQLQSTSEAIQLGQRQLEADQAERAERKGAELAALHAALRVQVDVGNVVDSAELATEAELAAVERWRQEYGQRGWVLDASASTWEQGSVRRSNADLLTAEPSPLVHEPWFVELACRNTGTAPLVVQGWTVLVDGAATAIESGAELGSGDCLRRRLGTDVGLVPAYASRSAAEAAAADVTVVVEGRDSASRRLRIIHPPPE